MKRREFIKITVGGVAVLGLSGCQLSDGQPDETGFRTASIGNPTNFALDIMEVQHEMVDGTLVYSWAYAVTRTGDDGEPVQVPSLPGPALFLREGQPVELSLRNSLSDRPAGEYHGFAILGHDGTPLVQSAPLAEGESDTVRIPDNLAPGIYVYEDWCNAPVGRVLGLHGVLVVMPAVHYAHSPDAPPYYGFTPYGSETTPPVSELFSDLGQAAHFPGEPWLPHRQVFWIFSEVDPYFNERAQYELLNPADLVANYKPQYFTLNGRSGYFAAEGKHYNTVRLPVDFNAPLSYLLSSQLGSQVIGKVGQPILIRAVNVGLSPHSPHVHANHGYIVAVNGQPQGLHLTADGYPVGGARNLGIWWVDTWSMRPGDRKDILYPMTMPPDIPAETWERMKRGAWGPGNPEGTEEMWAIEPGGSRSTLNLANPPAEAGEFTHLAYPMHSHLEVSQTAAGGNYPMGQITHIVFTGIAGEGPAH